MEKKVLDRTNWANGWGRADGDGIGWWSQPPPDGVVVAVGHPLVHLPTGMGMETDRKEEKDLVEELDEKERGSTTVHHHEQGQHSHFPSKIQHFHILRSFSTFAHQGTRSFFVYCMIEEVLLQIKVGRSICWESSVTWLWVTRLVV
ncbi:uncharacterized protein LOC125506857 [Triticum urartu]|uniref:uncharacterized protein LOC125506857 n=1 Tax=Triticum urartu TaxID=4572 RepID=UPI002042D7E9|nr:uncharacterized protein LOC125506857 [Triticum urartu]